MDSWIEEVRQRIRRKNQVLFSKQSEYLQDLSWLISEQNHRVVTLWALELAEQSVHTLQKKYPEENRPLEALKASREWASGKVKMRYAQRKILDCHAVAKELEDKEDIALCHAIGQACAVVHTAGHGMGYPIYELSALVYKYGIDACVEPIALRKEEYISRLLYWVKHIDDEPREWADFMMK